jgi:hypothetical protein
MLKVILAAATLFASVSLADAATYYVDPAGTDAVGGAACTTEASPCRTIQRAISNAELNLSGGLALHTVLVKGSSATPYQTNGASIFIRRSGSQATPFTLKNYPGHSPVVQFNNSDPTAGSTFVTGNITITGTVASCGTCTNAVAIRWVTIEGIEWKWGSNGINIVLGEDIVVRKNYVHHMDKGQINGVGRRVLVEQNIMFRNGPWAQCAPLNGSGICNQFHASYFTGPDWTFKNNLILESLAYGIQPCNCHPSSEAGALTTWDGTNGLVAVNNTIAFNEWRPAFNLGCYNIHPVQNIKIYNNLIYNNSKNTLAGSQGQSNFGDWCSSQAGSTVEIRNNIVRSTQGRIATAYNNNFSYSGNCPSSPLNMLNANCGVNPPFINPVLNPATWNFRMSGVQGTQPDAIDDGFNASALGVTNDLDGGVRPQGAAYDIGAYEFGSVANPDNPTGPPGEVQNFQVQ